MNHHPACTHAHYIDDEPCRDLDDNELPDIADHHPLCDDNGWDHPGPCVIETELPADPADRGDPYWDRFVEPVDDGPDRGLIGCLAGLVVAAAAVAGFVAAMILSGLS